MSKKQGISTIVVEVPQEHKALYVKAAQANGMTLSDWVQNALDREGLTEVDAGWVIPDPSCDPELDIYPPVTLIFSCMKHGVFNITEFLVSLCKNEADDILDDCRRKYKSDKGFAKDMYHYFSDLGMHEDKTAFLKDMLEALTGEEPNDNPAVYAYMMYCTAREINPMEPMLAKLAQGK